jgi:MFS family permease
MVAAGGFIVALSLFSYIWADGLNDLYAASVLFGLGGGISMPALMALTVTKGNKTEAMGSIMSIMTMGHSFGMLVGSLLGGMMMDMTKLKDVFPLGGLIMLSFTGLFLVCTRPVKKI